MLGSGASHFNNGFGSDITGIDLIVSSFFDVGNGLLTVDFSMNHNDHEVKKIEEGTINASRAFDLENQVPTDSAVLTFNYAADKFEGFARANYYGSWKTTGGLFSPGDASDATRYGSEILFDVEARYRISDMFMIAIGGENIFDTFPDKEADPVLDFLGVTHALTSPYGFNGGFWYARFTAQF